MPPSIARTWIALSLVSSIVGCADPDGSESLDLTEAVSAELHGHGHPSPHALRERSRSGSRLEALFLHGPGNYRELEEFWDRDLGVRCRFNLNQDLVWECQPDGGGYFLNYGYKLYTDPTCSDEPVVILAAGESPPLIGGYTRFITGTRPAAFGEPAFASYQIGQEIAPAAYYFHGDAGCTPDGTPRPGERFFKTREVPEGTLVTGTEQYEWTGSRRIRTRVVHGADGSRSTHFERQYDTALAIDVDSAAQEFKGLGDGARTLVWQPLPNGGVFLPDVHPNASCTGKAMEWLGVVHPYSLVETEWVVNDRCDAFTSPLLTTSTQVITTPYISENGTCTPFEDSDYPVYAVGRQVRRRDGHVWGRTGLAPLTRRFSRIYDATDDGGYIPVLGLYDHELDARCRFVDAGEVNVCLPVSDGNWVDLGEVAFSDAACTHKIIGASEYVVAGHACYTGEAQAFEQIGDGRRVTMYRGGTKVAADPVQTYVRDGAACVPGAVEIAYEIASTSTHTLGIATRDPAPRPSVAD